LVALETTPPDSEDAVPPPAEAVDPSDPHSSRSPSPSSRVRGLARIARPRQWLKNLLVFVAPAVAGVLFHRHAFLQSAAAFGIFCLAASGAYFLNDSLDAEADRAHPVKRHRPIAAGLVPVGMGLGIGTGLLAVSIVLGWVLAGWHMAVVMGAYGGINALYSLGLKNEPILDLAAVSSGFVLRAVAGGVAAGVPLSNWFLIVASFGSLLIVTGKRSGEKQLLDDHLANHDDIRQTLGLYSVSFLLTVRTLAAAVSVTAYCLWAFERASQVHPGHDPVWFQLTIVPFVIALLHVVRLLDSGEGAAPEELAIRDHRLQIYGLIWIGLFAIGIYG
jgi:decaprenyl-phosphate phosphoribosyltransferase